MRAREGSDWVVRMHSGRFGWWERRALRQWLSVSPDHARDLLRAETVWRLSATLVHDTAVQRELQVIRRRLGSPTQSPQGWHRRVASGVALLLVVVSSAWLARLEWAERYETATGEQRMVALSDGSTVAINTSTRVAVDFSDDDRQVVLERGEALFDVAQDAARPFIVRAGNGSVRAVGTRFNVLMDSQQTVTVAVLEGQVELKARSVEALAPTLLSAGQSAAWGRDGELVAAVPERASRERIVAWREGKLRFDAWPLARAIEEHNRYATRPIRLNGAIPGDVEVSGVFRIGDTEALIEALGELMDVEAVDAGNEWLLVERPPPGHSEGSLD